MFSRPRTVDAALALLGEPNTVVLSGGTDFYPQRLNRSRVGLEPEHIVDIGAIEALHGISETTTGWRIGAATTWTSIATRSLPSMFDGLRSAAMQIGGTQIQNVGTVAGNLCTASPAADGVPTLLTLDPTVELRSLDGTRQLPLSDFITGYRSTALRAGELVIGLDIPAFPSAVADVRSSFVKLGSRAYLVISIAMVAALLTIEDDAITGARIAVGSCSPVARRLPTLEAALVGTPTDDRAAIERHVRSADLACLTPIDDVRASGNYRTTIVPQLVIDAIAACRAPMIAGTRP